MGTVFTYRSFRQDLLQGHPVPGFFGYQAEEAPTASPGQALPIDVGLEHLHDLPDHQRFAARGHLLLLQPVPIHTLAQQSQVAWKEKKGRRIAAHTPQLLPGGRAAKHPHSTQVSLRILSGTHRDRSAWLSPLLEGPPHPTLKRMGYLWVVLLAPFPSQMSASYLAQDGSTWMHHLCNLGALPPEDPG